MITLNGFFMHWVLAPTLAFVAVWLAAKALQPRRRVWKFVDRDEVYFYSARTEAEAREIHVELYVQHTQRPAVFFCVGPVASNYEITIEDAGPHGASTKPAYLWAKENSGLIGSTER